MLLLKKSAITLNLATLLATVSCAVPGIFTSVSAKNPNESTAAQQTCDPRTALPWLRCDIDFRSPSLHLSAASYATSALR